MPSVHLKLNVRTADGVKSEAFEIPDDKFKILLTGAALSSLGIVLLPPSRSPQS